MSSFSGGFARHAPLTHDLLRSIGAIRQAAGQELLWKTQAPDTLAQLRATAMIQSTESSNRIEQVTAPPARIRAIVQHASEPQTRSEQEIAGYRDVLATIHENHEYMRFTPGVVLQLHRGLFRFSPGEGGAWKPADSRITETLPDGQQRIRFEAVPAFRTEAAMDELHAAFEAEWQAEHVDRLLLIPAYVLDFLCIHPFRDGNGRMARLLSLWLLYRARLDVGRFISLERVIEESKQSYYETLEASSAGWHESEHDLLPWTEYFLGTVQASYREFADRVGKTSFKRGAKTEYVLDAVKRLPGSFTATDVVKLAPSVSLDMVRKVLNDERRNGRLRTTGPGRGARWEKT